MGTINSGDLDNSQPLGWSDAPILRKAANLLDFSGFSFETPLGSKTAPFLRPTGGAANTGLYWTNTTNLSFSINGTERFRFGSTGRFTATDGFSFGNTAGSPRAAWTSASNGIATLSNNPVNDGVSLEMLEMSSAPSAPATGRVRQYVVDSGGKLAVFHLFPSGAAQQVSIEP